MPTATVSSRDKYSLPPGYPPGYPSPGRNLGPEIPQGTRDKGLGTWNEPDNGDALPSLNGMTNTHL